jgi:hypothetical protein
MRAIKRVMSGIDVTGLFSRWRHKLASDQHNPPRRPAAGAFDAGQQLHLPCPTAAAVMAHAGDDIADRHIAPLHVRLVEHAVLPAPIAGDPEEPRREGLERLGQGIARRFRCPVGDSKRVRSLRVRKMA